MKNKIINWTFSSVFRTIGRVVAYILIGLLLSTFIFKKDYVKADTLTSNVIINYYADPNYNSLYATSAGEHQYIVLSETNGKNVLNVAGAWFAGFTNRWNYMRISYVIAGNTDITNSSSNRWYCTPYQTPGGLTSYECQYFDTISGDSQSYQKTIHFQMNARLIGSTYQTQCQIDNSYITCYKNFQDDSPTMLEISYTYLDENNSSGNNIVDLHLSKLINLFINDNQSIIDNQNQNHNETISTITNDTTYDTNETSNIFEDFEEFLPDEGIVTQLVTLPISLYTNILNSVNGTCSPFSLGSLLGTNLTLPCINVANYLGSQLWSVIDILMSGFFILTIVRKFIKVFENMSSMKEGDVLSD